jgi:aminoglycoside phosphotransferase (APT) family kinase protein
VTVNDATVAVADAGALAAWLRANVDDIPDAPAELELISGGHSNLTVGVRMGDRDLVLRRPPVGAFLPSANDMQREHTFLAALASTRVPTPRPFGICDDPEVLGAPFYVMERLHGVVPHDPSALAGLSEVDGRRLSTSIADVLADLHAVDPDAVGLGGVAKRTGYLERQVRRWVDQYRRSVDGDREPAIEELAAVLEKSLPASPPSTIVHGDYRLGNLMVDVADRARIIGVFDWEMATLGDPLADVGYTLLYWGSRDRPLIHPSQACADLPGFLTAGELTERYAAQSGRPVEQVTFYVVLAAFKLAIIGLGHRALQRRAGGGASGPEPDSPKGPSLPEWALAQWRAAQ